MYGQIVHRINNLLLIKQLHMLRLFTLTIILSAPFFMTAQTNSQIKDASTPVTSIEFMEPEFHFGVIEQGEVVQNVFEFTNTGTEPLVISNAKGTCGCTVPEWPREPIAPGASAKMLVQFDSTNKKSMQSKRVVITANTYPVNTYIKIKGEVVPASKTESAEAPAAQEHVDEATFLLYPNPAQDRLTIDLTSHASTTATLEIYDSLNRQVSKEALSELSAPHQMDISDYRPGSYFISVNLKGKNRITKQFVKL